MRRWFSAKKIVVLVMFAALVGGGSYFSRAKVGSKSGGTFKRVGEVARGDLTQRVTVAGAVAPKRRTVITPPYSGYIKKMYVRIGDKVRSGDPVVSISQSLAEGGEVFPIRSPFSGTVVQVLRADGEYVEEKTGDNAVLVRIDDLSQLFVNADVPEIEITKLRPGQEVEIRASAILDKTYKGIIREISMAAREKRDWGRSSADFPVKIEMVGKVDEIRPGMSVLVDIIAAKREKVLTLRHEFLRKKGDEFTATKEDGAQIKVRVGLQNEEAAEIVDGLKEGDRIRQVDLLESGP